MTNRIVQSDIEIARHLMEAGCEESGIVAWLRWRGIDTGQAMRLVKSLRDGGSVTPELPIAPVAHRGVSSPHLSRRSWGLFSLYCRAQVGSPHHRCHRHRRTRLRLGERLFNWTAAALAILFLMACVYSVPSASRWVSERWAELEYERVRWRQPHAWAQNGSLSGSAGADLAPSTSHSRPISAPSSSSYIPFTIRGIEPLLPPAPFP